VSDVVSDRLASDGLRHAYGTERCRDWRSAHTHWHFVMCPLATRHSVFSSTQAQAPPPPSSSSSPRPPPHPTPLRNPPGGEHEHRRTITEMKHYTRERSLTHARWQRRDEIQYMLSYSLIALLASSLTPSRAWGWRQSRHLCFWGRSTICIRRTRLQFE
jgi:hypothetical protein